MNAAPTISVVTVCFNGARTLRRTIESVLAQTCSDFEYLIIDGASTDTSYTIAQEYTTRFAERLVRYRTISERDAGLYDAMNKAVTMCTGRFVHFLHSDDFYCEPTVLARVADYATLHDADTIIDTSVRIMQECVTGLELVSIVPPRYDGPLPSALHPGRFVPRALYAKYPFNLHYRIAADFDFFLRLYAQQELNRVILNCETVNFVLGGASSNFLRANWEALHSSISHRLWSVSLVKLAELLRALLGHAFPWLKKLYQQRKVTQAKN